MLSVYFALGFSLPALAQYKKEKDASIPLEHFYIEREKSLLRTLLSKFHWGLSTGFGRSSLRHDLAGFGLAQAPGEAPNIFRTSAPGVLYNNWVNSVSLRDTPLPAGSLLVSSDTASLGYKANGLHIPLKATVHLEFDRYRIGGGYSFEYTNIGAFNPQGFTNGISGFNTPANSFFMKKYFVLLGASVYRYYEYLLVVDANIGGYRLGQDWDRSLIQRGIYFNVGATVERELSEYFKAFVRPSYELKNFSTTVAESGLAVKHRFNAFYLNVGVTYRLPELRRCFLKSCHAQINHAHGNREYRSRRHPIYKKQNPHYGENYPELIKYKGKNKRKLSPY